MPQGGQIVLRRRNDLCLLRRRDARQRPAKIYAARKRFPKLHFNEHECFCVLHDEIYFAISAAVISRNQFETLAAQVALGEAFSVLATFFRVQ